MNVRGRGKWKLTKDVTGQLLKLALVKIVEYPNKKYDLYTVCKVLENKENPNEEEYIPLYNETFTKEQYDDFYKKPRYFLVDDPEE